MERRARFGVARIALTFAMIAVVALAGIAIYASSAPARPSSTTLASTSATVRPRPSLVVAMSPTSPLIAPGQTQDYPSIEVRTLGPGLDGTLVIRTFPPAGISLLLSDASVSLANNPQSIQVTLKADSGLSPGMYDFDLETSSATLPAQNQTFTIEVVPVLVVIQNLAFHPQNITVIAGTSVSWINLDSNIGCCDPGNHNVVFQSGANASSPTLKRLDSWSYKFDTQSVVEYYCSIHPFMNGQVTVTG